MRVLQLGPLDPREFGPVLEWLVGIAAGPRPTVIEQIDSSRMSARLMEPAPDMVVALQCWPDEFRPPHVEQLIAHWPLTRMLCVAASWCDSDARTRSAWPPAWRVSATAAVGRLQQEWELLLAGRPGVPATASREEAFAWEHLARTRPGIVTSVDAVPAV